MGTAGYMSPEQVRGEKLDARTDLFSFGLVLYEMATGQRAFSGKTAAVVHDAILHDSPVPVHDLNSALPARLVTDYRQGIGEGPRAALPVRCGDAGRLGSPRWSKPVTVGSPPLESFC